ncbi:hypothetical protein D3C77_543700 [compost metagenome]
MIARELKHTPKDYRPAVTKRLVEWWGLQIIHSLCGLRDRVISVAELHQMIAEIESDLIEDNLSWEFDDAMFPPGHTPHRMIERQIALVDGGKVDLKRATRDQWRAHEQRSSWVTGNPAMKLKVATYDSRLIEYWSSGSRVLSFFAGLTWKLRRRLSRSRLRVEISISEARTRRLRLIEGLVGTPTLWICSRTTLESSS